MYPQFSSADTVETWAAQLYVVRGRTIMSHKMGPIAWD